MTQISITHYLECSYWSWRSLSTTKTHQEIELGVFVKTVKLLPEWLGTACAEDDAKLKPKKHSISILEWFHCWVVYVAMVAKEQPECIANLMGYQSLVIEGYKEHKNYYCIGYDCNVLASHHHRPWSTVDSTIWNLTFDGQTRTSDVSII